MKKLVAALAIVVLLLCAQISQAADLQEGWYVKLGIVQLYCVVPTPPHEVWVTWIPSVQPGAFGPFQVTVDTAQNAPYPVTISVPTTQIGVAAGTEVLILGRLENQISWSATSLYVPYETNYEPSQMRIELFQHRPNGQDELIWSQMEGHRTGNVNVLDGSGRTISPDDSIYFKVVVVPEPSQLIAVIMGCCGLFVGLRRMRTC